MTTPLSLRETTIKIAGFKLRLHHLDDGRKVIVADDMHALIIALNCGMRITPADVERVRQAMKDAMI